jgi:pectate lyase
VGNGAHHIWLDHLDIADGQDGNLDITQGGDYVTVSWTHFHYTYAKEHRYSNLIAGSDNEPNSVGKLHITYMTSHWGERVDQRQPLCMFPRWSIHRVTVDPVLHERPNPRWAALPRIAGGPVLG